MRPREGASATRFATPLNRAPGSQSFMAHGQPRRYPGSPFSEAGSSTMDCMPQVAIRRELAARFMTTYESSGPYFFPNLLDTDAIAEQLLSFHKLPRASHVLGVATVSSRARNNKPAALTLSMLRTKGRFSQRRIYESNGGRSSAGARISGAL